MIASAVLSVITLFEMSNPTSLVSTHSPTFMLSCTQLFLSTALEASQDFMPPEQPQPGFELSTLAESFRLISLNDTFTVSPKIWNPYWALWSRQLYCAVLLLPRIIAAPPLSCM